MRTIEFTQDVQYESEGRKKGPKFKVGDRLECKDEFADRWLRRAVAIDVTGLERPARKVEHERARLPSAGDVQIPDDWRSMKAKDAIELAAALAEPAAANRNIAFDVIEGELAERAKQKPLI